MNSIFDFPESENLNIINKINNLIAENFWLTIQEITFDNGISSDSIYMTLTDNLDSVHAKFVSKLFLCEQKEIL